MDSKMRFKCFYRGGSYVPPSAVSHSLAKPAFLLQFRFIITRSKTINPPDSIAARLPDWPATSANALCLKPNAWSIGKLTLLLLLIGGLGSFLGVHSPRPAEKLKATLSSIICLAAG
jgi:hypothetical protein